MISKKRASKIFAYVDKHGIDAAKEKFGVSHDSVSRYVRLAKKYISENRGSSNLPKVLIFDTETAPMKGSFWSFWKQNIDAIKQLDSFWFMFCYSAKWLGHNEILNDCLTPSEVSAQDDSRIMRSLWTLIDEADIVIAHNLIRFDRKRMNTRFLLNGLTPPSPYRYIDTLVHLKKEFAFVSNRMDFVNKMMGLSRKMETGGMELWNDCYAGKQEALDKMQEYCDNDIIALEDMYYAISPWMRGNINFGVYSNTEQEICSHCGSANVVLTDKKYVTNASRFPVYKCSDCHGYSRGRYSELTLKKRKSLLTSIAF